MYKGWQPKAQVSKTKFATPNLNLGWQNPYMRIGQPKPKFLSPSSPLQTRIWIEELRIWGLARPSQVRHSKLEFGLVKFHRRLIHPKPKFPNQCSPPQTQTWVGEIRIWGLAIPNPSFQTQVHHPKHELELSKFVYESWPPKLKLPNPSSPPQTQIWVGKIQIWGLATRKPSFQTKVRHPKLKLGLAKSEYEGWPPQT